MIGLNSGKHWRGKSPEEDSLRDRVPVFPALWSAGRGALSTGAALPSRFRLWWGKVFDRVASAVGRDALGCFERGEASALLVWRFDRK